jgi:hypothetical protein
MRRAAVKRWGAVLPGVLLTLLVASVVVLALRVARIEAALRQLPPRSSPAAGDLKPGMPLGEMRAIAADGSVAPVNLSGRRLLFVYSTSCPYSRQMFPVWAEMGRRAGFERTAYLSMDDPAAPGPPIGSTPENGFLLPRESPLRARLGRVPQTIVIANGRVVSVDVGVLPSEAVDRILNSLNENE